ncbi:MAG: hypothetical protein HN576_15855 [Bacteriovoracaceae bacterium]|nr:hypothetical protein [Bacteriovoracaceae bacterium]
MRLFFFLNLLFSYTTLGFTQTECQQFANDCEYYSCVEEIKHCGKHGYLIGFGYKYCRKFSNKEQNLSGEGQSWIVSVRACLIERLDNVEPDLSCKQYRQEAIEQHVPCYTKSGYCDLSKKDKKTIIKMIRGSLWKPSLFIAGVAVLKHCKDQRQ